MAVQIKVIITDELAAETNMVEDPEIHNKHSNKSTTVGITRNVGTVAET